MGIFSLFGKKERQPDEPVAAVPSARRKREPTDRAPDAVDESLRDQAASEQRQAARATALKIDAIESEMSSEFVRPIVPRPAGATTQASASASAPVVSPAPTPAAIAPESSNTTALLGDSAFDAPAHQVMLEDVPLFEEVAVLFANGQTEMVEQILRDAIEEDALGNAILTAWGMLFDLLQINGDKVEFEHLSIAYASRFETSPPAWMPLAMADQPASVPARAAATPTVAFTGSLDGSIVKSLEKARALAEKHPVLRLEFVRITEVDPIGCGLLLRVLKQMQKSGLDLILVGAPELVAKIRSILAVGRRDETEAPWLLLLELLELLNQESAFEEASIDYCVTFEVSPPAFAAPKNKVTTAMEEPQATASGHGDTFLLPSLIEGRTDALVAALGNFAAGHNPATIDCASLARIDVNAAGQLMAGLLPITGDGRVIEFINVNHLVAALFNVIGLRDIVQITTRRI